MEADFQLQEHLRVGLPFCFMALDGSRLLPPCSIRQRRKETSSKHKLARGLFKMADLKPSMQCKPNPTLASFALSHNPHPRGVGTHDKTRKYTWVRSVSEIES